MAANKIMEEFDDILPEYLLVEQKIDGLIKEEEESSISITFSEVDNSSDIAKKHMNDIVEEFETKKVYDERFAGRRSNYNRGRVSSSNYKRDRISSSSSCCLLL